MAGSVNKVILVGNLGRDPEIRNTQDGMKVVNLSVATSERWKDRMSGEPRERTEWHRVVIFNENLARVAEQYLRRDPAFISKASCRHANGPTSRAWKNTPRRLSLAASGELTLLGGRGDGAGAGGGYGDSSGGGYGGGGGGAPAQGQPSGGGAPAAPPPMHGGDAMDDDIPF